MKKILSLIFIFAASKCLAQTKFAINGGLNFGKYKTASTSNYQFLNNGRNYLPGFQINAQLRKSYSTNLYAEAEIGYDYKTSMHDFTIIMFSSSSTSKYVLTHKAIKLSPSIGYTINSNGLIKLIPKVGIYGAANFNGKIMQVQNNNHLQIMSTNDLKIGNTIHDDIIKPIDYGVQTGFDIQFGNHFLLTGTYQYGIKNMFAYDPNLQQFKNRRLNLSIGYIF